MLLSSLSLSLSFASLIIIDPLLSPCMVQLVRTKKITCWDREISWLQRRSHQGHLAPYTLLHHPQFRRFPSLLLSLSLPWTAIPSIPRRPPIPKLPTATDFPRGTLFDALESWARLLRHKLSTIDLLRSKKRDTCERTYAYLYLCDCCIM